MENKRIIAKTWRQCSKVYGRNIVFFQPLQGNTGDGMISFDEIPRLRFEVMIRKDGLVSHEDIMYGDELDESLFEILYKSEYTDDQTINPDWLLQNSDDPFYGNLTALKLKNPRICYIRLKDHFEKTVCTKILDFDHYYPVGRSIEEITDDFPKNSILFQFGADSVSYLCREIHGGNQLQGFGHHQHVHDYPGFEKGIIELVGIRYAIEERKKISNEIKSKIKERMIDSKLSERVTYRELLRSRIKRLRKSIQIQKQLNERKISEIEEIRKNLSSKEETKETSLDVQKNAQESINEAKTKYKDLQEKLSSIQTKKEKLQKRLMEQLFTIVYDVNHTDTISRINGLSIYRGDHLLSGNDTSIALGWVVHLLTFISEVYNFPLLYPVQYSSSRSLLFDLRSGESVSHALFCLHNRDRSKLQRAVYLLGLNIEYLINHRRKESRTTDSCDLLKSLIELKNEILEDQPKT